MQGAGISARTPLPMTDRNLQHFLRFIRHGEHLLETYQEQIIWEGINDPARHLIMQLEYEEMQEFSREREREK